MLPGPFYFVAWVFLALRGGRGLRASMYAITLLVR